MWRCKLCISANRIRIDVWLLFNTHNPSVLMVTFCFCCLFFFLSSARFSRLAPDVSHTPLLRAAHHGLLAHEHVQQGLRQHRGQPGHDHAGRHLVSGRPLQDRGGGELLQPQAVRDQGGSRLTEAVQLQVGSLVDIWWCLPGSVRDSWSGHMVRDSSCNFSPDDMKWSFHLFLAVNLNYAAPLLEP